MIENYEIDIKDYIKKQIDIIKEIKKKMEGYTSKKPVSFKVEEKEVIDLMISQRFKFLVSEFEKECCSERERESEIKNGTNKN